MAEKLFSGDGPKDIEQAWSELAKKIPAGASDTQRTIMRECFFAGAYAGFLLAVGASQEPNHEELARKFLAQITAVLKKTKRSPLIESN